MHLALTLFSIFAVWRWGDWKHWQRYHPTMLYITAGGFLYEYISKDYVMWIFHPDFLYNHTLVVVTYAVLTMPLNVLLYLSHFPESNKWRQLLYICKWVAIYAVGELVLEYFGRISYQHGWNYYHSILFDMMMFPMLRLHHVKPLIAYVLSVIIVVAMLWMYQVPLK